MPPHSSVICVSPGIDEDDSGVGLHGQPPIASESFGDRHVQGGSTGSTAGHQGSPLPGSSSTL